MCLSNYSLFKKRESDIRVRMIREAEKSPLTSSLSHSSILKAWDPLSALPYSFLSPICLWSKTSMVCFSQLVFSSALLLKANFIVRIWWNISQQLLNTQAAQRKDSALWGPQGPWTLEAPEGCLAHCEWALTSPILPSLPGQITLAMTEPCWMTHRLAPWPSLWACRSQSLPLGKAYSLLLFYDV